GGLVADQSPGGHDGAEHDGGSNDHADEETLGQDGRGELADGDWEDLVHGFAPTGVAPSLRDARSACSPPSSLPEPPASRTVEMKTSSRETRLRSMRRTGTASKISFMVAWG